RSADLREGTATTRLAFRPHAGTTRCSRKALDVRGVLVPHPGRRSDRREGARMASNYNARILQRLGAALTLACLALTACACKAESGGSCDGRTAGGNRCFEYTTQEVDTGKSICNQGRKWSDKACNRAGAIGGCETSSGITKWVYPDAKVKTRKDASTECTEWL